MKKILIASLVMFSAVALAGTPVSAKNDKEVNNKEKKAVVVKETEKEKENRGLHLGQLKKNTEIKNKGVSSSTLAFQAAVKTALLQYQSAMKKAKIDFLAAIKNARLIYFGKGTVTSTPSNLAPTIVATSTANPMVVTGTTSSLSVLGADDGGEAALVYSWSTLVKPVGAADPVFSANNSNTAKNTVVTFAQAGTYQFLATVTDAAGQNALSTVGVVVNSVVTSANVSPSTATITTTGTQQFAATALDQFGKPVSSTFTWSVLEGVGAVSASGLYTPAATGTYHVVASGAARATSTVYVVAQ